MGVAPSKQSAEHEGLTQEHFNFGLAPISRWDILHEGEQLFKIHGLQLGTELAQKCRTHIDVKILKAIFGNVGIPQPDDTLEIEFPQQQAIHPFEGKLDELNAHIRQVLCQVTIDPRDQFFQPHNHALDTRLVGGVMILDFGQNVGQAPIDIRLHLERQRNALQNT